MHTFRWESKTAVPPSGVSGQLIYYLTSEVEEEKGWLLGTVASTLRKSDTMRDEVVTIHKRAWPAIANKVSPRRGKICLVTQEGLNYMEELRSRKGQKRRKAELAPDSRKAVQIIEDVRADDVAYTKAGIVRYCSYSMSEAEWQDIVRQVTQQRRGSMVYQVEVRRKKRS